MRMREKVNTSTTSKLRKSDSILLALYADFLSNSVGFIFGFLDLLTLHVGGVRELTGCGRYRYFSKVFDCQQEHFIQSMFRES